MDPKVEKFMRSGYESFNRKDIAGTLDMFDENIEWTEPEWTYGIEVGTIRGRDNVAKKVFAPIGELYDEFRLEPREFYGDGDTVCVVGSFKVTPKGSTGELDVPFTHIWKLRGDKCVSMRNYIDVRYLYEMQKRQRAAA